MATGFERIVISYRAIREMREAVPPLRGKHIPRAWFVQQLRKVIQGQLPIVAPYKDSEVPVQVIKYRLTILVRPTPTHDDDGDIAYCVVSTKPGWPEEIGQDAK